MITPNDGLETLVDGTTHMGDSPHGYDATYNIMLETTGAESACKTLPKQITNMKIATLHLLAGFALIGAGIQAQETPDQHESDYRAKETFTEFKGVRVWSREGEKLGIVEDMTLDLRNGRVVEVLVRTGGFLGIGARTKSVAPKALSLDYSHHVLRLDGNKAKFAGAPDVDLLDTAAFSDKLRVAATLRYFGHKPWFYLPGETVTKNAEILQLGHVERATHLLGVPIINTQGDPVGRVNALTLDMPKGHVTHVIVKNSLQSDARRVIQAQALRFNDSATMLILNDSLVGLPDEPHFKWVSGARTAFQQESYVNRNVQTDDGLEAEKNGDPTSVNHSIAMESGDSFRDEKKTRLIRELIRTDSSLSANSVEVEVVTLNAQTTLRGHVHSEADRRKIGQLAEKHWRSENVSNLPEVRRADKTP